MVVGRSKGVKPFAVRPNGAKCKWGQMGTPYLLRGIVCETMRRFLINYLNLDEKDTLLAKAVLLGTDASKQRIMVSIAAQNSHNFYSDFRDPVKDRIAFHW